MKTVAALGCGVVLGAAGLAAWLAWYFRDVYR